MTAVAMSKLQLDLAAESALEADIAWHRISQDGVLTPRERKLFDAAMQQCRDDIEAALAYERIADSIRRTGRPNDYVIKTYSDRVSWLDWFRPGRLRRDKRAA